MKPARLVGCMLVCGLIACSRDVPTGKRCNSGDERCASAHTGEAGTSGALGNSSGSSANASANQDGVDHSGDALTVHIEDIEKMTIEVVTLACAGACADIEAVARGGNPPYAFAWDDGSTSPKRHVCLDANATLEVSTTDTAIATVELGYEAHTSSARVTANVLDCSDDDGGVCEPGAGPETPASGHYLGSGAYRCDNDMDPAVATLINNGELTLDLAIDPDATLQTGNVYFQWGLVVIVGTGKLEGALGCGGGLESTLVDGVWGLPGADPLSVIPTGVLEGDVQARATGPGSVTGGLHWISYMPDGARGNECFVEFQGTLQP